MVMGAGTVGVCCALYLQRDGHQVTLVDRQEPGAGCSYGNGGIIQIGACVPVATPGVLSRVPKMLLDPQGPLIIRWRHLPWILHYLVRFVLAARPGRVEAISLALAGLLAQAKDAYAPLIKSANAEDLIRHNGELYIYRTKASFRAGKTGHDLRRERGVRVDDLSTDELRQLVPDLSPEFKYASYLPDCVSTTDPFDFTKALAEDFARNGGTVLHETVTDIEIGSDGPETLVTDNGRHTVNTLVLAAGAWSKPWAAKLGNRVLLDTERGYHVMIPDPGIDLRVPMVSGDYRFGLIPMTGGLRLAGTAELAGLKAPPYYERADMLVPLAKRLFPGMNETAGERWMGHRPSTPDSLPVLGRSPRFRNAYFAFGHGHLGLTMGGITGQLIADLVADRIGDEDVAAFRADRF